MGDISGPRILFSYGSFNFTESMAVLIVISVALVIGFFLLGRNLRRVPTSKRQLLSEYIFEFIYNLGMENLGENNMVFSPIIGTLFLFSLGSALSSMFGFRSPTSNINIPAAWAIMVFIMTIISSVRSRGPMGWFKSFIEPAPFMLPINIISKIIEPVGLTMRKFGNQLAGMVIMQLLNFALLSLTNIIFSILPFSMPPILQIGIPAVLSAYFDLFSGFLQAYIFALLSMSYIGSASKEG